MARTKKTLAATSTVTRDAADMLVERLNQIDGLAFVRDAWENKAPDNYGVVELDGDAASLWADDHQVGVIYQLSVHLYVTGGGDGWIAKVQAALAEICDGYSMPTHEYAYDISKNHWLWRCRIIGPLQWTESEGGGNGTA